MNTSIPGSGPLVDLPAIKQLAFVVADLEEALAQYVQVFGIEPWTVYEAEPADFSESTYHGDPAEFGMRYAVGRVGDLMLELIEPTAGPSIYHDHLEERGEGIHHVAYFSWSEAETRDAVDRLETAGFDVMQHGTVWGTEFWYFDARAELNGLVFETAIRRDVADRDATIYPPDADPDDAVR